MGRMRREGRRRKESRFRRLLRLIGIGPGPESGSPGESDSPPDIGVHEPRRPRPSGSAGAAVLDPPRSDLD
jgi:hypothetical protein